MFSLINVFKNAVYIECNLEVHGREAVKTRYSEGFWKQGTPCEPPVILYSYWEIWINAHHKKKSTVRVQSHQQPALLHVWSSPKRWCHPRGINNSPVDMHQKSLMDFAFLHIFKPFKGILLQCAQNPWRMMTSSMSMLLHGFICSLLMEPAPKQVCDVCSKNTHHCSGSSTPS